MPSYPFLGEGSPTKIDYRKKGTLILNTLLEDVAAIASFALSTPPWALCFRAAFDDVSGESVEAEMMVQGKAG